MTIGRKSLPSFVIALVFGAGLSAQTIIEFPLPEGTKPLQIIAGPDGHVWFTTGILSFPGGQGRIGRMTTAGDVDFLPSGLGDGSYPAGLTAGSDGNVWALYGDQSSDDVCWIYRVTPSGEHTKLVDECTLTSITTGLDGTIWFTRLGGAIGRLTTAGLVTNFSFPQNAGARAITPGIDGNLWFHFDPPYSFFVGRITPTGVVTDFAVPTRPGLIRSGPDGNVWFAISGGIARLTTSGAVTEFVLPGSANYLVAAPDGNIWFTYDPSSGNQKRLGRITTAGTFLGDVTLSDNARSLTVGADGNLWFSLVDAEKIGRLALTRPQAIDSRILPIVGSTAGVGGSYFRTAVQLHNPTVASMAGRIVFHRSGASGGSVDPVLPYSLSPGQTQSVADLLPVMGRSGLGSADLETTSGSVPAVTARVFNDAGSAGTTGFTEEPVHAEDALRAGLSGALLLPADVANFRFNVGVRTLEEEPRQL